MPEYQGTKLFKIFAVVALSLFVGNAVNAQIKVGANFGLQLPLGTFGDGADMGIGGNITGEYMITENIGAGLGFGYYSFGYKGVDESATVMPITASGSYYFLTEGFKPYAGVELGAYMLGSSFEGASTETYFGFAPVVGAQYDLTESFGLNANLKYNYILSEGDATSTFGINVGVVYTFGN